MDASAILIQMYIASAIRVDEAMIREQGDDFILCTFTMLFLRLGCSRGRYREDNSSAEAEVLLFC